ncbi:MAG: [FeFe] hydrogenase H-cluster radical SAM maturase HydE [Bacillota bacterium]
MNNFEIKRVVDKAYNNESLKKDEIIALLAEDINKLDYLFKIADKKRKEIFGDEVHLRAIIEFSSYCNKNCYYCGLRKDNDEIKRYQLSKEKIIETALMAADLGYKTVVLQSGEDDYEAKKIADIIKTIKKKTEMAVTLSVGERDFSDYKLWYKAGADRYLLKHECANEKLYKKYHPGMSFKNRIATLKYLKKLGYQIGSGVIIGLPEQTVEILANDLILAKNLDLDMIGSGPFIAHQKTPLKDNKNGTIEMTLKFTALSRLLLPLTHIPATTALGTIDSKGREKALKVGANVVMPNVTDSQYRDKYEIYPDKICVNEKAGNCRKCIGNIISSLGRKVSKKRGDSLKK